MSEFNYGVNVENLLYDLSQHESDDISDFEFYGEDEQGREGSATIDITLLAADAVKLIAELKAARDALAAENSMLKSNLMFWDAEDPESPYDCPEDIANNCDMAFNTEFDVQVAAKMPNRTYRVSEVGQYDCKIELISGEPAETPATDAYLNSVRAEGADKVAEYHFVRIDALKEVSRQGHLFHKAAYSDAVNVANLFRAGKDGE